MDEKTLSFYSPGKLMLTGEYFVLDGAKSIALPTKVGQSLHVKELPSASSILTWKAYHMESLWLDFSVDYHTWEIIHTNDLEASIFIINTLKIIQQKSQTKLQDATHYRISTHLEFPPDYGLGSSSTLMANLAKWAGIDAFKLNSFALGGSGYDIAVAISERPIIYTLEQKKPKYKEIDLLLPFKEELIFIHLGRKQNSREGIKKYQTKKKDKHLIFQINEITDKTISCRDIHTFSDLMTEHESIVSSYLKIETTKQIRFADCPVFIKSLGAWGGDFVMSRKFNGYQDYFASKNSTTILDWKTLIKE